MQVPDRPCDLVSLGEPLLRLAPPHQGQLRRATALDVTVAGSQMNVAANLARLGRRAVLLTRLPNNPLGQLALDACRAYGIDVSHVRLVDDGKMGITYVEFAAPPRTPLAVYDRQGSAASQIVPDDFPWSDLLSQTRFAYTDGIFPGLSGSCRATARVFIEEARRAGCLVVFDVNYREHLWSESEARSAWAELLPGVDILITNRGVSETVFGFAGADDEILRRYAAEFGCRLVCLTQREYLPGGRGAWTSRALLEGRIVLGRRQEFDVVDRYGTGDAFCAGLLYGLAERGVEYGLDFASALVALAHSIEGDVAHVVPDQVSALLAGEISTEVRR